jgi:hypothetical protein
MSVDAAHAAVLSVFSFPTCITQSPVDFLRFPTSISGNLVLYSAFPAGLDPFQITILSSSSLVERENLRRG